MGKRISIALAAGVLMVVMVPGLTSAEPPFYYELSASCVDTEGQANGEPSGFYRTLDDIERALREINDDLGPPGVEDGRCEVPVTDYVIQRVVVGLDTGQAPPR